MKKRFIGADWIRFEKGELKSQAQRTLSKVRESRQGKKYALKKICDKPLTYIEVELKD